MMPIKRSLKSGQEITIRTCTNADLTPILTLQEEVIQTLTTTSFLQPLSKEEFLHVLSSNGMMIGAFFEGELIAFRALLIPDVNEANHLGEDARIPKEAWAQIIYSEVSNVSPRFRGNGLQKILGELIIGEIDTQKFRYVCATVAPFNIASLLDKFAHGLKIIALKEKYEGLMRYILMRDFEAEEFELDHLQFVQMDNVEEQQVLLEAGWKGVKLEQRENQWFVGYQLA